MRFGLLLPHFGANASPERLFDGVRRAEVLGFDAVFVRDHVVYEPHAGIEDDDPTFYDALTTLTAVGAVTERIGLGTGALVPFRHPIHLARVLGTMTALLGDRLLLGLGTGRFDREFASVGLADIPRTELVKENVGILRALFRGEEVTREEGHYRFAGVAVSPRPRREPPIWYCGSTPASARLAVELGLGWLPGRITLDTIARRRTAMAEHAEKVGGSVPSMGVIVPTRVAANRDEALRGIGVEGLLKWANDFGRWWVKPPSGRFERAEDLKGSLVAGSADDIVGDVEEFRAEGLELVVFDLRTQFAEWPDLVDLLGTQVLPRVSPL